MTTNINWDDKSGDAYGALLAEVNRCRTKFPTSRFLLPALIEEVGELAGAIRTRNRAEIRKEAIQVACVAIRIAEEVDPIDYQSSHVAKAAMLLGEFVRAAIANQPGRAWNFMTQLSRVVGLINMWDFKAGEHLKADTCFATRTAEEGKP